MLFGVLCDGLDNDVVANCAVFKSFFQFGNIFVIEKLRAISLDNLNAFFGTTGFKENSDFVPFCGCDGGKSNASVTTREVNDFSTRLQFSFAFGSFNHAEGGAILDRTCSVEIFELCQDMALGVVVLFEIVKFKKRCMPNKFCNRMVDM